MLFRVQCVDKATGAQSDRIYRADAADRAAEMAMREGYIVGHVFPEADVPLAPAQPGRLESYGAKPPKRTGIVGFFSFDVMIYPVIIRAGFIVATSLALLASIATPILWLIFDTEKSGASALLALYTIGWIWAVWIGYRLLAEWLIVFFTIREELIELNANSRPRG